MGGFINEVTEFIADFLFFNNWTVNKSSILKISFLKFHGMLPQRAPNNWNNPNHGTFLKYLNGEVYH